jgi:type IV secretion system protein VirD4
MRRDKTAEIVLAALGLPVVVWLGLLLTPVLYGDRTLLLQRLSEALANPTVITTTEDSLKTVLLFIGGYALGIGIYFSSRRNWRRREEHGSAKWGEVRLIVRRYRDRIVKNNKILTQNFRIGFNARKHKRNLNVMVVGGSGSGKTRTYAKPNVMQANCSMVILDPKGEILRDTGTLLERGGFEVRVLDLIHMERSHCYNPLLYCRDDNDVQRLSTNLFKATTPKGSVSQDPFWDTAAAMLHQALVFFLLRMAPPEEQNYQMVMELLRCGEVSEEQEDYLSILDMAMNELERIEPTNIALKYYRNYKSGSAKTLKSIQVTLASRLEKFNLESLAALTATDELDLASLGEKKVALFALIPDNDTSYNFLVSILYTQLFQQLFELADRKYDGELPVHVHFVMDEFSNVSLPSDFDKILSVMRSRGVSASIILQNLAQLKALFEKEWESITGNCDEFLYLGGNEAATHKYVSELLGKETIDHNTFGRSTGRQGNYSTNWQISGRELLTPDEVRMLDNRQALVFVRGERPMMDEKFDISRHPNVALTADGGMPYYRHGVADRIAATIDVTATPMPKSSASAKPEPPGQTDFIIESEEEVERSFKKSEQDKQQSPAAKN